jgi:hypothetical protein
MIFLGLGWGAFNTPVNARKRKEMPGNKGKNYPGLVAKAGVVSSNLIARSMFPIVHDQ